MDKKPAFPDRCPLCGAPVEVKQREFIVRGGANAAVFTTWVGECTRCGEILYTPDTVAREFTLRKQLEEGRLEGLRPLGKLFAVEAV